ncbi:MAG TPA: prenyltransferase/squalene oxidase repeat-containing protein [Vicinamibacterales bacterium]
MLQVARLAPALLGESAALVTEYLQGQQHEDGGFRNRAGDADLYYTVFGLEGLAALRAPVPVEPTRAFLERFGDGVGLDLVHLSCLARCWANLPGGADEPTRAGILARLQPYRSADGGFNAEAGAETGTAYGAFVAMGAYQDLGAPIPDPDALVRAIGTLTAADGSLSNFPEAEVGITPATAAGVALLRQLEAPVPPGLARWLLAQAHPQGGFRALPGAPMPDLLSTATALHALVSMHADIEPVKEPCLDFLDSLWTNRGGFYGNWEDDEIDCEYTYYGLLALGHLSL